MKKSNKDENMSKTNKNSKRKVLVVDDEPHIVNLIKLTLDNSYEVLEAYSGNEAIQIAKKETPDLITMDLMMPAMSGFDVCSELRNNPITKDIPIIIVSAKNTITDKLQSIDFGAVDYITKPFEPEEFKQKVLMSLNIRN